MQRSLLRKAGLLQRATATSRKAPPIRHAATSRTPTRIMAFRSEKTSQLLQAAERYHTLIGSAGHLTEQEVEHGLRSLIGTGTLTYKADGVVYQQDRTMDAREVVGAALRQHNAYKHLVYRPVAFAANEEENVVFIATYYVLSNHGMYLDKPPTNRLSRGMLLEKLEFEPSGRLAASLVCRQLTQEESHMFVKDASKYMPATIEEEEWKGHPIMAIQQQHPNIDDISYMKQQLTKWVTSWTSGADINQLDKVLAPDVRMLDGYGLWGQDDAISFEGREAAKEMVAKSHKRFLNAPNNVLSHAVSDEAKVGFQHWKANLVSLDSQQPAPVMQGLGLVLFDEQLQIHKILEFTMQHYDALIRR